MNRLKKIRGNNRRFRKVDLWVQNGKTLDLEYLKENKRNDYRVRIDPWGTRISMTNSQFPEPTKKIKQRIIIGLIEIYDCWRKQLEELNKPYYLKIWLYFPNFSNSQVVCAIDDKINFYQNTFYDPNDQKELDLKQLGRSNDMLLKEFCWTHKIEEDFVYESEWEDEFDRDWLRHLNSRKKVAQRIIDIDYNSGHKDIAYGIKIGDVWLGFRNG
ncbi:MAG: hypothetical protein EP338_07910 [Bacteroidetes bacterium]|nr:MAG: hypothetical protein EP338_07910 [Bacteroidota bacterium]